MKKIVCFCFAACFVLGFANEAAADSILSTNERLYPGQMLVSPGCYYHLDMQTDGNLVIYGDGRGASSTSDKWATNTVGRGAYAVMQEDGNFVVYNLDGSAVWASGTSSSAGAYLNMQDDGNLVVYNSRNSALWSSGTAGESLGVQPCTLDSETTVVNGNYDRPGSDYYVYYNPANYDVCATLCTRDSSCRAFTYVPPNVQSSSSVCWLKDSVPAAVYRPGMTSGYILQD
jgi:hypothetical protein